MATDIRAKHILLIVVLFSLSTQIHAQELRVKFCTQFRRCFNMSPVCFFLYQYFRCHEVEQEPREIGCGLSLGTGRASLFTMPRIIGGLDSVDGEFPWSVRLLDDAGIIGMCGGTILNRRTVLTAAHCVSSVVQTAAALKIGYGSVRFTSLTYIYASRVDIHPDYIKNGNKDNDIAVVTLSQDLPLSASLPSACLPAPSTTYTAGRMCIVTGWGRTQESGSTFPDVLQKAAVPLVPLGVCQLAYSNVTSLLLGERQLCAGYYMEGGVDACQGDSGGPLVCPEGDKWVINGIVSQGLGCGRSRFPGVYTYVPQYVDWIRSVMN